MGVTGSAGSAKVHQWWTERCNALLLHLLDPANFSTSGGVYDPTSHFLTVLSIDRLVACTLGSVTNDRGRNGYLRKLFLFEALEILEGLRQGSYERLCDYSFLEAEVQALEARLPAEASRVLIPRCRRAIEGVRSIGEGFIPERRRGQKILVAEKDGTLQPVHEHKAIAAYLRSVRNGTHSYRETVEKPRSLSLLAGHTGEIPNVVADVAALHFLRIFSDPDALFRVPFARR
jgi:hypothetical protein